MNKEQKEKHIELLLQRLSNLQLEQTRIIEELQRTRESPDPTPTKEPAFKVGDKVRITNSYRGEQGLEGTIITANPKTARIETSNGTRTRKYKNLIKIGLRKTEA